MIEVEEDHEIENHENDDDHTSFSDLLMSTTICGERGILEQGRKHPVVRLENRGSTMNMHRRRGTFHAMVSPAASRIMSSQIAANACADNSISEIVGENQQDALLYLIL